MEGQLGGRGQQGSGSAGARRQQWGVGRVSKSGWGIAAGVSKGGRGGSARGQGSAGVWGQQGPAGVGRGQQGPVVSSGGKAGQKRGRGEPGHGSTKTTCHQEEGSAGARGQQGGRGGLARWQGSAGALGSAAGTEVSTKQVSAEPGQGVAGRDRGSWQGSWQGR